MKLEIIHSSIGNYTIYYAHYLSGKEGILTITWDCDVQSNKENWWWRKNQKKSNDVEILKRLYARLRTR